MFVQVIEGKTNDADRLYRQMEKWERELRPGAIGYQGSTGGCTDAGDCILVARFDSRETAERNSARPEQGAWWAETESCFTGPVAFHETDDVQVMTHGDLDAAHFVQVMEGRVTDHDRAMALERDSDAVLAEARPDLLGSVTAYFEGDTFTGIAYFTSEDAARRGETRAQPDAVSKMMAQWQEVMQVEQYFDIRHPWLVG